MIASIEISTGQALTALTVLVGTISALFWMLIASKEREHSALLKEKERDLRELELLWKSFRDISTDSEKVMRARENSFRAKEGLPALSVLVPVVPESFSPSTELGRANAQIATLRASLAQIKISAGIEPTPTPEVGTDKR